MDKILILHGWTYNLEKWGTFTTLLDKNNISYKFLKIPGLTAKSDKVWDLEKYSSWLETQVGLESKNNIILMGHSNGGRIAAYFVAKNPGLVKKLILVDSAGIYHNELPIKIKRLVFMAVARVGKMAIKSAVAKKMLYKLAREKDYHEASPNMKQTMINLTNSDITPYLKDINIPTLVIWGEEDKTTRLSDGRLMNRLIENSNLRVIKGARHSPFYSHPEEVLQIIKNDI